MIVIGGSLGGLVALREILRRLPEDFPQAIAVVLHRHRDAESLLVSLLQPGVALPVSEAEDKEPIESGRVYLCPADYHLLIEEDSFALSTDDLVNFARPSVDVLLESAAEWEGNRAIAVILTGGGSDGAAGAKRIRESGGIVLVQDPRTAEGPWMPLAAINAVPDARVLTLPEIADALVELARHS